jgi:hypothetical protein
MVARDQQSANVEALILVTDGNTADLRALQYENAHMSIVVALGKLIADSAVQLKNALA